MLFPIRVGLYSGRGAIDGSGGGGGGYTGPGDIVSGATAWWGLRAYSAAKAGNACIDIEDSGGLNPATIHSLASGGLDLSTLDTWITAHGTAFITKIYDQVGTQNLTVTSASVNRPQINRNAINASLPAIKYSGGQLLDGAWATLAQPYTMVALINSTSTATLQGILCDNSSHGMFIQPATSFTTYFGGVGNYNVGTPVSGTFYFLQAAITNSTTGHLVYDTTDNTMGASQPGGASLTTTMTSGGNTVSAPLTGNIGEMGIWPSAFTTGASSQATNMQSNVKTFWTY